MAKTLKIAFMLLLPLFAIIGCNGKDRTTVAEFESLIQRNLKPGDPAAKIEEFFKQNKLPYDFDRFGQMYQCRVPSSEKTDSKGVESVILIHNYVNEDRSFKKAEDRMSYTYL